MEKLLNDAKDSLAIDDFEKRRDNTPLEFEIRRLRSKIIKSKNGQNVTKAWLKCIEMLELIKFKGSQVFFNAELPGGFVLATNHYLGNQGIKMEWYISSLYPKQNNTQKALGDTYEIISRNVTNSLVGPLKTNKGQYWCDGDVTNPRMPNILGELVKNGIGKVDLYTADGGLNVVGEENKQEKLAYPIILGEVKTGLLCLKVGGFMILKIYTFFSEPMKILLSRLIKVFDEYKLYKPSASPKLNSEIYFIGIGYHGVSEDYDLENIIDLENNKILTKIMNELATDQITEINKFLNNEMNDIKLNYDYVGKLDTKNYIPTK